MNELNTISNVIQVGVSIALLLLGFILKDWVQRIHAMLEVVSAHTIQIAAIEKDIRMLHLKGEELEHKDKEIRDLIYSLKAELKGTR